jgi:Mg2+ and Co2+ transporter CorA
MAETLRSTPALRILRLFRALLFGSRVGHGLQRPVAPAVRAAPQGEPQVTLLRPGDRAPCGCNWDELLRWAQAPTSEWLHASNLEPRRLAEVAAAAGIPHVLIEAALHESSYPRIEDGARWSALTLSLPSATDATHRDPILLLVSEDSLLSLAQHPLDLQRDPPAQSGATPWGPHCALHVIGLVLARDEELAGSLESAVRRLEQVPASSSPQSFFEETFRLKRVLSTAKGDLWRLHGLLEMVADGRRQLPGLGAEQRQAVAQLAEEADYLYETIDEIRESVLSLIELHIDVAAHDTTRFMRLLAIVSTLALIPALAGGLLGMNLGDSPWSVTLGQVTFGTLMLMLGVLYAFMAKGWLR